MNHDFAVLLGLQIQLKNSVYKELIHLQTEGVNTGLTPHKEPLDFVRSVQVEWEKTIKLAVIKLCADSKAVFFKQVLGCIIS